LFIFYDLIYRLGTKFFYNQTFQQNIMPTNNFKLIWIVVTLLFMGMFCSSYAQEEPDSVDAFKASPFTQQGIVF
jgi:hypothetical protein